MRRGGCFVATIDGPPPRARTPAVADLDFLLDAVVVVRSVALRGHAVAVIVVVVVVVLVGRGIAWIPV